MALWPLFGTTNQLLAGLTLTILTVMLIRKGRPFLPILIPAVFLLFMTIYAAFVQLVNLYNAGDWLLLVIDIIIIVAAAWVLVEAVIAMLAARKGPKEPEDDVALTEDQKLPGPRENPPYEATCSLVAMSWFDRAERGCVSST